MKEDLQSVMEPKRWHPDADQLTAFAEQALPLHEREQTLVHLAVCGPCREAVFLAQQAIPVEVPAAATARRPWFAGWNLVWPAVAALAGVVGLSVYLRHGTSIEHPAPPVTVAVAPPEPVLPAVEAKPTVESKKEKVQPLHASGAPTKTPPLTRMDAAPPVAIAAGQIHGTLPTKPGMMFGSIGGPVWKGSMQQAAAAPVNMPPQAQNNFVVDGVSRLPLAGRQTTPLQSQSQVAQSTVSAPPPPAPMQQSEVVTVDAAAASLNDIPATTDNSAKFAALLPELPSHLETVSSISNGMATVAVDAGGAVFESRDEGKHWKTVDAQWAGRPVRVSLQEERNGKNRAAFAAGMLEAQRAPVDSRRVGSGAQAELHGTVTDPSGASIAGAQVQVRASGATGDGTSVRTDGQGRFAVPGMAAGRYEVTVTSPGFVTFTRGLSLEAGVQTGMSATLQVGAATETVNVESNAPVAKAPVKAPAFQLTTDTGAVWTSSDGRSWKRR